jgi:hypothetical protein
MHENSVLSRVMSFRARQNNPMSAIEALERILTCNIRNEVIKLTNRAEFHCQPKFESLWVNSSHDQHKGAPGLLVTMHEGTLNGDRIENWVRVLIGIVEWTAHTPSDVIEKFLRSSSDGEKHVPETTS